MFQGSTKPRIGLVVSQYLGTNAHGAEAHTVVSFTKMLSDEYDLFLAGGEVVPKELETIPRAVFFKYYRMPKVIRQLLHLPAALLTTLYACKKYRPDLLVCCCGPFYGGIACVVARALFGIPVVMRATEDHLNHYKFCTDTVAKWRQYVVGNILSMWALRRATMVLATGEKSRDHFATHGVKRECIVGIPGPIQRGRFHPASNKKEVRQTLGLPLDKKIILYVGGIQPVKGAQELLEVIKKVQARSSHHHFVIVGKEVRGTSITKQLHSIGADAVTMVLPQPHDKLVSYYQAADVFLFLTKVGVGYGQVNIEATLCETPIVAWDPGLDVKEFLKDSCVDSLDKIVEKLLSGDYHVATLLPEQDDTRVKRAHLDLFKKLIHSAKKLS